MTPKAKLKPLPWRKLSADAEYSRSPEHCQCCGRDHDLALWIECDEGDQETDVVLMVCTPCVRVHIEPHERLYHRLEPNRPFPGAMVTCWRCIHRDGFRCQSPLLKANRGAGLPIRGAQPTHTFFCGKGGGVHHDYGPTPPRCEGFAVPRLLPVAEQEVRGG